MIENVIYIKFNKIFYILDSIYNFDDKRYKIIILDNYMI